MLSKKYLTQWCQPLKFKSKFGRFIQKFLPAAQWGPWPSIKMYIHEHFLIKKIVCDPRWVAVCDFSTYQFGKSYNRQQNDIFKMYEREDIAGKAISGTLISNMKSVFHYLVRFFPLCCLKASGGSGFYLFSFLAFWPKKPDVIHQKHVELQENLTWYVTPSWGLQVK